MHDLSVTVVAVATPQGRGGVGCVRLSGERAEAIASTVFRPAGGRKPTPGSAPCFGRFLARDGAPLDHGYLVLFEAGRSYTGETTAELWAHGSPAVLEELLRSTIVAGAEPAGPGEFTYRALRHGRLDLARAEAVRDLVAARTLFQARVAFAQAEGAVARRLAPLIEALEESIARGEAAVEFVEESETHLPRAQLAAAIETLARHCRELLAESAVGRVVREGARVAIVGLPNVGKSSLFNRLIGRERAIVADQPGTTRDTLDDEVDLNGLPVRLIDTAGLREIADPVESEGVRRAREARAEADLVVLVLDRSRPLDRLEREALDRSNRERSTPTLIVDNKADLPAAGDRTGGIDTLAVSAKTGQGIEALRSALRERLAGTAAVEPPALTDARHARALEEAAAALERARRAQQAGLSEELLLEDLREARAHLGAITGEFGVEALYDRIFSTFCIGK